jgi:hypothetical protein
MSLGELRRRFPLGERRPLLVTEVTRMNQAVCVACYDLHASRIVRPLPWNITNWSNVEYTSGRITVGTVLGVVPANPQPVSAYPHASEDLRLAGNPTSLAILTPGQVVEALRSKADRAVSAIFDGNLLERKYVEASVECRSLGAIMAAASQIHPFVNSYDKLRVRFTDASGTVYDLPVTDMDAQQVLIREDADAATGYLQGKLAQHQHHAEIMLRLGLARAFSGEPPQNWYPMRCYLQCNGFLFP